ncbi:GTP cyclohydrolase I [Sulfuracidifex tepidarius]|uniref:GTP cyclohydrolase 1 n=1 Tax=Sulfuracidifex tepidarius TaxID=1294262 RepID=A0A510E2E6_9CREN|nr:GTP cyclohydrolase I [Sulfuracidifex tepidarius]BBG26681.1 GTP cyclohydrolase 1 [Sulfuracidifex tepidarius]
MEKIEYKEKAIEEISVRVKEILELLGEDVNREGLRETPTRVAKALYEMTSGLRTEPPKIKVFNLSETGDVEYEEDQLIVAKDVGFSSLCEHHLLPFIGKVHIAYVVGKGGKVAGFSKLIRITNYYASRPQIQERLVSQIADALMNSDVEPKGVLVIGSGVHMCSFVRGVKDREANLVSIATRGVLKTNRSLRNQAMRLIESSTKQNLL